MTIQGRPIKGPDGDIVHINDEKTFIHRYIPTARALLATYDVFINDYNPTQPGKKVNDDPKERNNLLLDLNQGKQTGFDSLFAAKTRVDNVWDIFGMNGTQPGDQTPVKVARRVGTGGDIYPFTNINVFSTDKTKDGEVWYDFKAGLEGDAGDTTVPLASAEAPFIGSALVTLSPSKNGATFLKSNTTGDVTHIGLLSNGDVQQAILVRLG